ncbi:MAG: DUF6884 domain-containing protein [Symbiobacteriia bacterium]
MKMLVVTSCTGEKAVDPIGKLTIQDFRDSDTLRRREAELSGFQLPAGQMYTGQQHVQLMRGVNRLRRRFGADSVALQIISAGYGLIDEDRLVAPYEVTFNAMKPRQAREWAEHLRVARDVRAAISGHELVVFLLGARYLQAILPPLAPAPGQRLLFLAKPSETRTLTQPGVTVVPAGKTEATQYHAGIIALKGRMFGLMAHGLEAEGDELWCALLRDDTPATASYAMDIGGKYSEPAR